MRFLALLLIVFLLYKPSYAQNIYSGIALDYKTLEPAPWYPLDFNLETPIFQQTDKNALFEFTDDSDSLTFTEILSGEMKSIILYPGKFDTLLVNYEGFKQAFKSATVCVPLITASSVNSNKEEDIMYTRNQTTTARKHNRPKKKRD